MGGGEAVQGVRGAGEDYIRSTTSRFTRRRNVCLLWILIICRSVYRGTFSVPGVLPARSRHHHHRPHRADPACVPETIRIGDVHLGRTGIRYTFARSPSKMKIDTAAFIWLEFETLAPPDPLCSPLLWLLVRFAAEIEKGMSSTGCQNNSRPLADAALFPSLLLIKRHDILPTFSSGSGRFRRGFLSKLVIQSPLPSRRCLLFATQLSLL